jgi:hypothetical protein
LIVQREAEIRLSMTRTTISAAYYYPDEVGIG